ncbi:fatty acid desaturase [Daejeonella lutea]|uniref:Beta-carotene ketolase (CrtW type) n=1 Tax=Daejeonella lutea TaxID=572036 RepID=A0A1T5CSD5_9SPHI|nr:fatty acid desaturase [Daejeonella lutea]SKB62243.1 beta-carotene ketolase (CrtW type) [Daejeonella lutea]
MSALKSNIGVFAAFTIIGAWLVSIIFLMDMQLSFSNPMIYLMILVQMHLYTGLFITAHDAMHGTVSSNKLLNNVIGQLCTILYACFPFKKLYIKHHEHHAHVHTDNDPDYHQGSFIVWYFNFIREYISWWQIVLMAIIFNILKLWVAESNLLLFWVLPSLLSTLQLFYFGTWVPHHGEHDNEYQSRSQGKNHIVAFLSCYFFGYHYEHHDSPGTPWWRLWKLKEANK